MKIYPVRNIRIRKAIVKTARARAVVLQKATQPLQVLKQNSKSFVAAAIFSSVTLNAVVGKFINKEANTVAHSSDVFERSIKKQLPKRTKIKPQIKPKAKAKAKSKANITASNTTLTSTPILERPLQELNDSLNALLLKKKNQINPIKDKTSVFIEKGNKYNVNPLVLMGIAMHESARGTSVAAVNKKNIGGIMGKNGLRSFKDVDECIDIMAATIAKHSKNHNLKTVNDLAYSGKYCDKKVAQEWAQNVMYYVKKLS